MPQSTKPEQIEKPKEEVIQIKLRPDGHTENIILDSKGCPHHFSQVTAMTCQCDKCNLGLFGNAVEINKRLEKLFTKTK